MTSRARRWLLDRARSSGRPVTWTHPGVRFGNFMYMWLHASTMRRRGGADVVLVQPEVLAWLDLLPALRELSITRDRVRVLDRRELGCDYQHFGVHFAAEELPDFVATRILTAPGFRAALAQERPGDELVVNVRRGDYYSPQFRGDYGFDQATYLRIAAEDAARRAPVGGIRVVSDGLEWCRSHLGWLVDIAPVTWGARAPGPLGDLVEIGLARRLVVTNSTFSYWGAYIGNTVHGDNHADVWAPRFHHRGIGGGRAWQLDPRWTIVEELPGGWDEP